jgi:hypothetical protein
MNLLLDTHAFLWFISYCQCRHGLRRLFHSPGLGIGIIHLKPAGIVSETVSENTERVLKNGDGVTPNNS